MGLTLLLAALASLLMLGCAQQAVVQSVSDEEGVRTAPLEQSLPMTTALRAGTLGNGMRYYVRENREPENRAFLRLAINVGSLVEEDDALGAAHYLEHMAFNGTERFEKRALVEYMESIGMRPGPGVNATTSFDETVYMLTVPTDGPEHIETAFEILEDWTQALALDPEEIDAERGIVMEEWRGGQGVTSRVRDQHFPVLFRGSRYAERLPIGTPESIEAMDREKLEAFYRDWYRPELMAVVAVGDFEAARIEDLIRRHFGDLPASASSAPERIAYDVPAHPETLFSVVSDPEVPAPTVQILHKMPPTEDWTIGGYRQQLVELLYNNLLNLRLQEIAREPDAPFLAASSQRARPIRASSVYTLAAAVSEDGIEQGLGALLEESARVARFGFTESELERGKTALLRSMQQRYTNRGNRPSPMLAAQYVEAFLIGRPIPSIEDEDALHQRFVPDITLEEVNAVGREWLERSSRVVLVTAPQREGLELPDEAALAAVLGAAGESELEHYVDTLGEGVLLDDVPAGSRVVETRTLPGGLTEWYLANGIRVVLRPTDFTEDQVVFRGLIPGGWSLASDEELVAARTAANVIMASGLGEYDVTQLQRLLTGTVAAVNVAIADDQVGIAGQVSAQDLQTAFELIYLRFTAPRADANAFATLQRQMQLVLGNQENNPAFAFNEAFNRLMTQDHPRAQPLRAHMLDEMSLERSLAFYRERFGDASGATFLFVGAFDLETMRPLVERYIGALPASGEPADWLDHAIRPPEGVVEETVYRGLEPQSQTRLAFNGEFDMADPAERILLLVTGRVLQVRLSNVLREELGGTYNVSVEPQMRWRPVPSRAMVITFGSDPGRADELVERIFVEFEDLKRAGPSAREVADVQAAMLREHETNMRQNAYWLAALGASYQYEADPGAQNLLDYGPMVEAMTPEVIREGMARYLDPEHYVRVTLMPER